MTRGLRRDTENILIYWKKFICALSFKVSISSQHLGKHLLRHQADIKQALHQAFHQGGSRYSSKTSLSV